jgi:hypothetical protein
MYILYHIFLKMSNIFLREQREGRVVFCSSGLIIEELDYGKRAKDRVKILGKTGLTGRLLESERFFHMGLPVGSKESIEHFGKNEER